MKLRGWKSRLRRVVRFAGQLARGYLLYVAPPFILLNLLHCWSQHVDGTRYDALFWPIALVLLVLVLGILACLALPRKSVRAKISCVVFLYVALAALYGAAYHTVFVLRPTAYGISSHIQEARAFEDMEGGIANVKRLNRSLYLLGKLEALGDAGHEAACSAQGLTGVGD